MPAKIFMPRESKNAEALNPDNYFSDAVPALLKRLYLNRGITHENEINYDLSELLNFKDLLNIDKAAQLLAQGIQQQHKFLIVGDFDADGATSTALAIKALKAFGALNLSYLIPNRFEYGYGLTPEIVDEAQKQTPDILITVDNGISSHEGVLQAKKYGMKVIITDHHLAGETLPQAEAIINPNQPQDKFKSKHLAGIGVIFYVMLALRDYLKKTCVNNAVNYAAVNMSQFLDLVALGTVADVVCLDKNNRILVFQGLRRIRQGRVCAGIEALLKISGRKIETLTAADLSFGAAPRLNAAGRLKDMSLGVECLLAEDTAQAHILAHKLDQLNRERRIIEADMVLQADTLLEKIEKKAFIKNKTGKMLGLCLYHPDFHQGVIGILAGRLKDRYHQPVIVFSKVSESELKGSARSISDVHLRDLLALIHLHHPDIVNKFGGHAMAAGLTIGIHHFKKFSALFHEYLKKIITPENLKNILYTDGRLLAEEFSLKNAAMFHRCPWGQGFPEPVFEGEFELLHQHLIQKKHLKLWVKLPETALCIEAVLFNRAELICLKSGCKTIYMAYRLQINEYQGSQKLQLMILQIENV